MNLNLFESGPLQGEKEQLLAPGDFNLLIDLRASAKLPTKSVSAQERRSSWPRAGRANQLLRARALAGRLRMGRGAEMRPQTCTRSARLGSMTAWRARVRPAGRPPGRPRLRARQEVRKGSNTGAGRDRLISTRRLAGAIQFCLMARPSRLRAGRANSRAQPRALGRECARARGAQARHCSARSLACPSAN